MRRAFLVATALGCLWTVGGAAPSEAQDGFPELDATEPAGSGEVVDCGATAREPRLRCGVFRVDEDGRPGGRAVDLHFVIRPAADTAARQPEPVLYLPGGPGGRALPASLDQALPLEALAGSPDLLLVDRRGIGPSNDLNCTVGLPDLRTRFESVIPPSFVEACRASLEGRADLRAYTTRSTVDDLEALRRWLGYPAVNIVGASYGTRVAQVYLRRYPDAVRTAVLAGVAPLSRPTYVDNGRSVDRALDHVIQECQSEPYCDQAFPRLAADLVRLRRTAAQRPETRVQGEDVTVTSTVLAYALRGLLYGNGEDVPYLITQAADEGLGALADYYLQRTAWLTSPGLSTGNHLSVICAEDIAPVTPARIAAGTAGTLLGPGMIDSYVTACGLWPHAQLPSEAFEMPTSDVPTLILSGERDPVTPPSGGALLAGYLPTRRHIVVPRAGHAVFGRCMDPVVHLVQRGVLEDLPECRPADFWFRVE